MARRYLSKEVVHTGLNKRRIVKASNIFELHMKVNSLEAQWDEQWARTLKQQKIKESARKEKEAIRRQKEAIRQEKQIERETRIKNDEDSQRYALDLTQRAEETQQALDSIVINRTKEHVLNPEWLKDHSVFSEPCPVLPALEEVSNPPLLSDAKYNPTPSFFTKLSKRKMLEFNNQNASEYDKDYQIWKKEKDRIDEENEKIRAQYNENHMLWEKRKTEFLDIQRKTNSEVDELFEKFNNKEASAIEKYLELLLGEIEFPFDYSIEATVEYNAQNKGAIVELFLPVLDNIPKLKSVSYVKTRKEFKETYYTESYLRKKYDNVVYQIVLVCLDTIFYIGNRYNIIDNVVINGRIDTIDKATGKNIQPCVLSLAIQKDSFAETNIDAVDPKVWFKSAKGVSAASIAGITPIAPIVQLSKEDSRFIEGYEVSDQLVEGVNLAAIDWQDFENLIRELFEKEFSVNGGEVKITQASRDGGVDAVAFDPDPIRGGKIVIQAKRYTNVVGVSAVRDLYGTVLNEGANKGILVTTSNYGNDAYNFIKDKPLTLLNGANLLYLMEKHGYKARIDLKEAKEILKP